MMLVKRDVRYIPLVNSHIELREGDGASHFVGYAVRYNEWSGVIAGAFREQIVPGAFARCLVDNPDIIATIDHNPERCIGRTSAGTLTLADDVRGLFASVRRGNTSFANDLAEMIARRDIQGMSFTFDVPEGKDKWERRDDGLWRTVQEAELYEVAFVTMPAYPTTDCALRSLDKSGVKVGAPLDLRRRRLARQSVA